MDSKAAWEAANVAHKAAFAKLEAARKAYRAAKGSEVAAAEAAFLVEFKAEKAALDAYDVAEAAYVKSLEG
jgi:hypothetical protein